MRRLQLAVCTLHSRTAQYHNSLLFGISDRLLRSPGDDFVKYPYTAFHFQAPCDPKNSRGRTSLLLPPAAEKLGLAFRVIVVFEIAGLVHQSLVGLAPAYLADDCRLLSDVGRRPLRSNSNDMRKLLVPRTQTNSVIGVSRPPVVDYGTTFHPDYGGRDLPSTHRSKSHPADEKSSLMMLL